MVSVSFDTSGWIKGLENLKGPLRESLARSMAVAGGKVLRDEAKRWAPVEDGVLKSAIYLAHKEGKSNDQFVTYSISWNARLAPHGHLLEFGHWQPFQVIYNYAKGGFQTLAKGKGGGPRAVPQKGGPKWVGAKPFLRPAFDVANGRAKDAMIERGRQRLPELLAGANDGD